MPLHSLATIWCSNVVSESVDIYATLLHGNSESSFFVSLRLTMVAALYQFYGHMDPCFYPTCCLAFPESLLLILFYQHYQFLPTKVTSNSLVCILTTLNILFSVSMAFNVTMITFWMTLLINKWTNIVVGDGWVYPWPKPLPSMLLSATCGEVLSDLLWWNTFKIRSMQFLKISLTLWPYGCGSKIINYLNLCRKGKRKEKIETQHWKYLGTLQARAKAVTMKLWEPKRKCPKAVPRHLQNHVVCSQTHNCSMKSYVGPQPNAISMNFYSCEFSSWFRRLWAQPAKICSFTTSTGFFRIWPVANLLSLIWTGQYPIFFYKCRLISSSL